MTGLNRMSSGLPPTNTSQQSSQGLEKGRLSFGASSSRLSMASSKAPRPLFSNANSGLVGIENLELQNLKSTAGASRNSLGSAGTRSSVLPRQSILLSSSSTAGRQSLASRQSLGFDSKRTSTSASHGGKDPRNLRDKTFQLGSIKLLVEFLAKNGYDKTISTQILNHPVSKDVQSIFRFLYEQLDPTYEFKQKFEDELLIILKFLRYPFLSDLPKSTLKSVTAGPTWRVILGALVWMVELIVCYQNCSIDQLEPGEDTDLFDYLLTGYQSFISGNEEMEDMRTELLQKIEQSHLPLIKEVEKFRRQSEDLKTAISALDVDNAFPGLQRERDVFVGDIERFRKFVSIIEQKRDKIIESVRKEQEELVQLKQEINLAEDDRKVLWQQVDQQQIKVQDVEKVASEKDQLLATIDKLMQQKEELNRVFWEKEISLQKRLDAFEKACHDFNTSGERIGVIPADAPFAKGLSLEISVNLQSAKLEASVTPSLKEYLQKSLFQLRDSLNDNLHALDEQVLSLQEQVETIGETIREKQEELLATEDKIRRYNQQYNEDRDSFIAESKKRSDEIEVMEKELQRLRSEIQNSFLTSQQFVQKATLDYDNLQVRQREEIEMVTSEMVKMMDQLLQFRALADGTFGDLSEMLKADSSDAQK